MPSRPQQFRAHGQRSVERIKADTDADRGSARQRGYGARWDRASRLFKTVHPLCLGCQAVGRVAATAVTDHVEPHKGDASKFWNAKRWQPSCSWHHDVVKQRLEAMYERNAITLDDLWLNSAVAIRLTLELL